MRVREAYQKFQEHLKVRNTIAGGIGETYDKPTSIPQGDPSSMMRTSLLMRAWIMQMHSLSVQPRLLADDLQIICIWREPSEALRGWVHEDAGTPRRHGGELGAEHTMTF